VVTDIWYINPSRPTLRRDFRRDVDGAHQRGFSPPAAQLARGANLRAAGPSRSRLRRAYAPAEATKALHKRARFIAGFKAQMAVRVRGRATREVPHIRSARGRATPVAVRIEPRCSCRRRELRRTRRLFAFPRGPGGTGSHRTICKVILIEGLMSLPTRSLSSCSARSPEALWARHPLVDPGDD
jgi:hypothetical protein